MNGVWEECACFRGMWVWGENEHICCCVEEKEFFKWGMMGWEWDGECEMVRRMWEVRWRGRRERDMNVPESKKGRVRGKEEHHTPLPHSYPAHTITHHCPASITKNSMQWNAQFPHNTQYTIHTLHITDYHHQIEDQEDQKDGMDGMGKEWVEGMGWMRIGMMMEWILEWNGMMMEWND